MGAYLTPFRNGLLTSAAAIVAVVAPSPAMAQTRNFDIPAQAASRGIPAFARQANIQILASGDVVRDRRTNAVHGSLTVDEGLRRLLDGTGLEASFGGGSSGIITVREIAPGGRLETGEDVAAGAAANIEGVAEILIVGTRSLNADVRRTENDAQPYVVLDGEEIERSGALTIDDFLRTRLPMNTQSTLALAPSAAGQSELNSAAGRINLRGLGTDQTLILVDGRRIPSLSPGIDFTQPNISGIPPSAIERVEVLPATASGIYGGSATGGVVNIILKRNYSGIDLTAGYGDAFEGGVASRRVSASGGMSLEGGRTRLTFSAALTQQNDLMAEERDFYQKSLELQLSNDPLASLRAGTTPNICSARQITATIFSCADTSLILDTGEQLNSSRTYIPLGYSSAFENPLALVANAGNWNLNPPEETIRLFSSPNINSVDFSIRRTFGRAVDLFLDGHGDWAITERVSRYIAEVLIPGSSIFNPFRQDIGVAVPTGAKETGRSELVNRRLRAGGIFRLPYDWNVNLEAGLADTRVSTKFESILRPNTQGVAFLQSRALSGTSIIPRNDIDPFLLREINSSAPFTTTLADGQLRFGGPILLLPAGPLAVTGSFELRREFRRSGISESVRPPATPVYRFFPANRQVVQSYYLEATAPLFGGVASIDGVEELTVTAAIRRDEYRAMIRSPLAGSSVVPSLDGPFPEIEPLVVMGASTDFTLAMSYDPIRSLRLRLSYGTGYFPPRLGQLIPSAPTRFTGALSFTDPRRGNSQIRGDTPAGAGTLLQGGSPSIVPERSRSFSAGVIYTPENIQGFRASVDYIKVNKQNEIVVFGIQNIIDNETLFPERIVRGPNLPSDPTDWAGPITSIDNSLINIQETQVEAVDLQVSWRRVTEDLGEWYFYGIGTWQRAFARRLFDTFPSINTVGYSDGPLEWRGNLGVEWEYNGWNAGWNAQYFSSYRVASATSTSTSNAIREQWQGSRFIPSQTYHDVRFGRRFDISTPRLGLSGIEISFGIQNIFNRRPPVLAAQLGSLYSSYGDPRLRRFTLNLRARIGR